MAEPEKPQEAVRKKKSRLPFLAGILLAAILGSGSFFAVFAGYILNPAAEGHGVPTEGDALAGIQFLPIDSIVISLGAAGKNQHLRMTSQVEVDKAHAADVKQLMPRILDVLNAYLRAVEVAQLQDPAALIRLRSQMLRRIQVVTGEGRVRDLLITEFVLN